ncbi:MAG: hypothetical protein ABWK05_06040 [Pyrobaculum sp.]
MHLCVSVVDLYSVPRVCGVWTAAEAGVADGRVFLRNPEKRAAKSHDEAFNELLADCVSWRVRKQPEQMTQGVPSGYGSA